MRRQPPRRTTPARRTTRTSRRRPRRPYNTRSRWLELYGIRPLRAAVVAGIAVVAVVAAVILLTGKASALFHSANGGTATSAAFNAGPAYQVVYTARTANDAAITLSGKVAGDLTAAGQQDRYVELDKVSYTGDVSRSDMDMTPRTGNTVLLVAGRAAAAIQAHVSDIQAAVDAPGAGPGGRALFVGLTKTRFGTAPVIIVSSGLDLSNPDNFRALDWSVPAAEVVSQVKNSGDLPALHGPVLFVLVPTAGSQPQLNQAQTRYLEDVWTALLKVAGATSVTFYDANSTPAGAVAPSAPAVPVTGPPSTPVPRVPAGGGKTTCTVSDGFFTFNTARLINAAQTEKDLTPCVEAALAAHATFALDGWTSYEGALNAEGQPPVNEPFNITLSQQRVAAIADILTQDFHVPGSDITHKFGHGNLDQPNPDPRSAANRVVTITYTPH